ncbi:hypothetical protein LTR84_001643 [Exophiala bonariae]|uniref:Hemerythrin-like domain-containing protein n=1 Tax=Exophiala bonariae TaxID=1690606 RepID=A0AAV9NEL4_9EURO|nr:hypothetical protein LTR84_001643 [Exophiala bonariae]
MATIRLFKTTVTTTRVIRGLAVQRSLQPISSTRFQSSVPKRTDAVSKINAATANMSSANAGTISDTIKHDYEELKEYYHNILSAKDDDSKIRWQNQFTWELARHSIGEELVVYPAMEKHMGEAGGHLAQRDRDEHNKVKELLYKFQGLSPTDKEFEPTIKLLWNVLGRHIEEEETEDLPKLEQAMPEGSSEKMSKSFERTKMFVPTRSHPSAPDKPPFETVAGLMAAPLDRLGDIFRRFP